MPRGYRFFVLAAFGWLIAASPPGQGANGKNSTSSQAARTELERIASALEKLPASPSPDEGCQPGQDDRGSDLCAQWKAADSAYASAVWTERTFWLGIFGLLIGATTLFFAARAAHWAKAAAFETKRAADVSEESVRPHLFPDNVEYGRVEEMWGNQTLPFKIKIKNYGTVPGFVTRFRVSIFTEKSEISSLKNKTTEWQTVQWPVTTYIEIGSGNVRFVLRDSEVHKFSAEDAKIFMVIEIDYTNGSRRRFTTKSVWETMPMNLPPQTCPSDFWEYT